jgi:uncharacterized protein YjbI with pentapeptide repeats
VAPEAARPKPDQALTDPDLHAHALWEQARVAADHVGVEADDVEIHQCVVERTQLTSARLEGIHVVDTVFEACELSGAILRDATLKRVEFRGCRLSSLDLSGSNLQDVVFTDCKLDWVNLRSITGERVRFAGSDLTDGSLYAARCDGLDLFDCTLTRFELSKATLVGVRLHGSTLEGLVGPLSLAGSTIASTQLVPLAVTLLAELGITIDDDARDDQPPP